jgi:hypothetical protein
MGYVVIVPLGAAIFYSLGRHPFAGLAAAFAGVSGGYTANLFIGTVDPLLAGLTEEAAQMFDPSYQVHPAVNWYFMIVSTFLITAIGTFVTARIVEPKLGKFDDSRAEEGVENIITIEPLSALEKKGLITREPNMSRAIQLAVEPIEERGLPFLLAVNVFDQTTRFDLAEIREALGVQPFIPLIECDARARESVKSVLVTLIEQVLAHRLSRLAGHAVS